MGPGARRTSFVNRTPPHERAPFTEYALSVPPVAVPRSSCASAALALESAQLIRFAAMKGRFLVVTSTDNRTVYVPLSRLIRIEASSAQRIPAVAIIFEGFQVSVQTSRSVEKAAQDLYKRLVDPDDFDLVYLRPDAEEGINDIRVRDVQS